MKARLESAIGSLKLKNPVMPASGCFDWFPSHDGMLHPDQFGAVVIKSATLHNRDGNPPPRIAEVSRHGMINSVGIPSEGIEAYLRVLRGKWSEISTPVISSISAFSPEEYAKVAAILDKEPTVAALEINLSCPNLEHRIAPAQDAVLLKECVTAVRESTDKLIIAKLSPNVTNIAKMAEICETAKADAICLINTVRGMAIDIQKQKPVLGNIIGGLSGPVIKPIALAMVYETCSAVSLPVIGVGGISSPEDAIEFLLAGACAIQVGSSLFRDPMVVGRIIEGIDNYLTQHGYDCVSQIVGLARHN